MVIQNPAVALYGEQLVSDLPQLHCGRIFIPAHPNDFGSWKVIFRAVEYVLPMTGHTE
jgi:hypothetical protein